MSHPRTPRTPGTHSPAPRAGTQLGCDSHPTLTPLLPSFILLGAPSEHQGTIQAISNTGCMSPVMFPKPPSLCAPRVPPHQPRSSQTPQPRLAPFAGCCKDTIITSNSCLSLLS